MSARNNKNSDKNGMGVIIALGAALVVGAIVLCVALISVLGNKTSVDDDVTYYSVSSVVYDSQEVVSDNTEDDLFGGVTENNLNPGNVITQNETSAQSDTNTTTTVPTTKNEVVENYERLSKNGDNVLSDHHENEFIKLVSEKYGIDTDLLVAIYSKPDTGNNFVLQFNGTKDSNGNIIKSPDTLEKVYQIDKAGNIKIATGTTTGNVGVSYAEGMLCFNMIKSIVMEQYPDYFTGLKK